MAQNKTSKAWVHRHINDHWVQQSQAKGYRSRAAFKLLEINEKDKLFRRGMMVVDLGSAPGSWSQVARELIGEEGKVFALDILPMDPIHKVDFIQGDFREESVFRQLENLLGGKQIDLVICDIAPNLSGNKITDQARSFYLNELALDFCAKWLKPGGCFVVKVFQGSGYNDYVNLMKEHFQQVLTRKPKASRDTSTELYLLGKSCLPQLPSDLDEML
ncbi:RlmE family RNA methyltransferase [Leeia sp. TBRC 13508]|uniref:Ribosomal RNA large subunit methyltransferase E n=1 Tax=Leeia speluncae TaxID=2884804 RepID=A0ABS8D236_9NEIS|nr:RlmE family RNA methyltransferase [Leeia speluncae]MCB6182264.1 RlmE family RNA methyltransferase [Leeia speluncae]